MALEHLHLVYTLILGLSPQEFPDIEMRQKPPRVLPHQMASGAGAVGGLTYLCHWNLASLQNCMLSHPYAVPLMVLGAGDVRQRDSS